MLPGRMTHPSLSAGTEFRAGWRVRAGSGRVEDGMDGIGRDGAGATRAHAYKMMNFKTFSLSVLLASSVSSHSCVSSQAVKRARPFLIN